MLHDAASDQGLHCLPSINQILDTSTVNQIDVLKVNDKYGKKLRFSNI